MTSCDEKLTACFVYRNDFVKATTTPIKGKAKLHNQVQSYSKGYNLEHLAIL